MLFVLFSATNHIYHLLPLTQMMQYSFSKADQKTGKNQKRRMKKRLDNERNISKSPRNLNSTTTRWVPLVYFFLIEQNVSLIQNKYYKTKRMCSLVVFNMQKLLTKDQASPDKPLDINFFHHNFKIIISSSIIQCDSQFIFLIV